MILSLVIRFIHWGIVLAIFINLFIIKDGEFFHRLLGYAAVLLVVLRLVYGLFTKNHRQFPNKIAVTVYFAMWGSLIALALTGFLMGTEKFWGEESIEETHEFFAGFLQALILIHFAGIAHDSYQFKRRTWLNMINGKKN